MEKQKFLSRQRRMGNMFRSNKTEVGCSTTWSTDLCPGQEQEDWTNRMATGNALAAIAASAKPNEVNRRFQVMLRAISYALHHSGVLC